MPQASLNALLVAYHDQATWLVTQAVEFETGARKVFGYLEGKEIDLSADLATEYRHKAGNLLAIIHAYERLHARSI